MYKAVILLALAAVLAQAQQQPRTTPVPILRQINSVNDDGSYSYGYEAADGSYKIETKSQTGEVRGKYGYYDDAGSLREIEYGANNRGFTASGAGIQVPEVPYTNSGVSANDDGDDGQCRGSCLGREEPQENQIQAVPVTRRQQAARQFVNTQQVPAQQQQQIQQQYYQPQPQPTYQQQPQTYQQINHGRLPFNVNLNSGSYSLQY